MIFIKWHLIQSNFMGQIKLTVVVTGKYTIQKAPLLDDRVQPNLV